MATDVRRKRIDQSALPPGVDALLTPEAVAAALSCTLREFRRRRTTGSFPPPDSPAGKKPKWRVSTVNRWIEEVYSRGERVPPQGT